MPKKIVVNVNLGSLFRIMVQISWTVLLAIRTLEKKKKSKIE